MLTETIRAALDGDRDAFAQVYADVRPYALSAARRVTRDAGLAEDAVQDAFLGLWAKRESIRKCDTRAIRSFVATAATREGTRAKYHGMRHSDALEHVAFPEHAAEGPDVGRFLAVLDAPNGGILFPGVSRARQVVDLHYLGGLSMAETAGRMMLSKGAAKIILARALETMRAVRS